MTSLESYKVEFYKGDTHTIRFTVMNSDDTLLDLTGGSGSLVMTNKAGATVATIDGSLVNGTDGVMIFKFNPLHTSALQEGLYYYIAKVSTLGGDVYTVADSTITLL